MTAWPSIECQRGCEQHATRPVVVNLGGPTGYADLPAVPRRLATQFEIMVWDQDVFAYGGEALTMSESPSDRYCPARLDPVSDGIQKHGVWEPAETIAALDILTSDIPGWLVDVGAHVGWFSVLAEQCGRSIYAAEADPANRAVLRGNIQIARQAIVAGRIDVLGDWPPLPGIVALAKINVEGAEPEAVGWLWPRIVEGKVAALIVEMSPVFHGRYVDMALRIVRAGYDAYAFPGKVVGRALEPFCDEPGQLRAGLRSVGGNEERLVSHVKSIKQENWIFLREDLFRDGGR